MAHCKLRSLLTVLTAVSIAIRYKLVHCLSRVVWQSRLVRNTAPLFIWGVRRDCIDPRFLAKEQIINHFGHASFTTKVVCADDDAFFVAGSI